jgi:hypothetical protein
MEYTAINKKAAMNWFLQNSDGELMVLGKNGKEARVESYPDAVKFFEENGEQ